ncbi:hypothetical protein GQ457_18G015790 [Hibiscus cannabinus]
MSFSQNPNVEEVVPANGLAVGFKGGRPPDEVAVVDGVNSLERSGSPVSVVVQPLQKRGRNLEEAMLIDDESGQVAPEGGGLIGDGSQVQAAVDGVSVPSFPSFKDKLVGSKLVSSTSRSLSDLDVDVKEDDVRIGGSNILPEIQFSDRVHNQVDAQLARSVIVRLLGKSIGYRALLNRVKSLWNPKGDMCIIDLDNDYYLVRFAIEEDFQKVLSEGPWVIYGSYLTVQPWSRDFSTSEAHPSHIMVWVRLPKLPYRYYTKSMFRHIANAIGEVVRVDYNTSEGKRGRFARLAMLDIEYEGLPKICFKCGRVGHSKDMCPGEIVDISLKVAEVQRNPTETYGPWMQVVNRRRRQGVATPNRETRTGTSVANGGSRFAVLEEEGNELGGKVVVSTQLEERVEGADWNGREAISGGRGRIRIISRSPSPKKNEADRLKVANNGASGSKSVREAGARLEAGLSDREISFVAAQGKVVRVKSALGADKYATVQVVDVGEGLKPKQVKNRMLPSSVRGSAPRGTIKKGHGHQVNSKLGVKQTKRDDRGQVHPVVHSSLAELVADLDRAKAAVKDSGIGLNDGSEGSDVIFWNVHGALDPVVARSFKLLCRSKVPDVVAIFEPRISGGAADRFIRRSGFTFSFRVEARGFSGGIWILWKDSVHIDILAVSNQFVHGHCVPLNGEPRFRITFIYASPEVGRRRSLWPQLQALEPEHGIPWILGGDLNVIGNSVERRGGSLRRSGVCSLFGDFLFDTELLDMGFHGPQFTWRRGNLFQRLDRCLCNKAWATRETGSTLFRYIVAWNEHEDFPKMLARSWSHDLSLHANISQFQQQSRKWSVEVFGIIDHRKRQLLARLRGIERSLETGPNLYLEELEKALKLELDIVLMQEESLWHQRARNAWIEKGDRNTRFFHLSAMIRKKRNSNKALKIDNQWCVDQNRLREHATGFFQQLFTSERQGVCNPAEEKCHGRVELEPAVVDIEARLSLNLHKSVFGPAAVDEDCFGMLWLPVGCRLRDCKCRVVILVRCRCTLFPS